MWKAQQQSKFQPAICCWLWLRKSRRLHQKINSFFFGVPLDFHYDPNIFSLRSTWLAKCEAKRKDLRWLISGGGSKNMTNNNSRQNRTCSSLGMGNGKGVGEGEGLGVCVLWLPCTTSSSLVYSPVCATCRSIVNSLFLVCLLFVALCICCCLSRFWCYANLCKACGQCRFLLWRKCYKCKYSYVCMFVLPTRLVTQSQQWAASSG